MKPPTLALWRNELHPNRRGSKGSRKSHERFTLPNTIGQRGPTILPRGHGISLFTLVLPRRRSEKPRSPRLSA